MKLINTIVTTLIVASILMLNVYYAQAANLEFINISVKELENDKLTIQWTTNQPAQGWLQVGMEPGKYLDPHHGPFKGIIRYHLGLLIPPPESGECYISVDSLKYSWKEGEVILFDETYLHFVHNDTKYHRIILFLDVKRPFNTFLMNSINDFILWLIKISPHNQKVIKKYSRQLLDRLVMFS